MAKVTFDYSKAAGFISDHEVESMKKITQNAKEKHITKEEEG